METELTKEQKIGIVINSKEVKSAVVLLASVMHDTKTENFIETDMKLGEETYTLTFKKKDVVIPEREDLIKCTVCETKVTQEEITNFASYGGLPSPCCVTCFSVNNYTIKDLQELKIRSLARRIIDAEKSK